MTQLDEEIKILFERMIKSWDKISNIKGCKIEFDNGLSICASKKSSKEKKSRENIPLKLDEVTFSNPFFLYCNLEIVHPDIDKLLFYINTPYRQYAVPEHTDRHEYADVLNTLDYSIAKFEEKKMKEYMDYFKSKR